MSLLLNVPYEQKDMAKSLGAKWNPDLKMWYVPSKKDYFKFQKWILNSCDEADILCDYFYIVLGKRKCFKCQKNIPVIGFGIENYFNFWDLDVYMTDTPFEYNSGIIHIAPLIEGLPQKFYSYLEQNYNFHVGYSRTLRTECYANHCKNCGVIQGNWFLFSEPDSPFSIDSVEKASDLTLIKVKLPYDFVTLLCIGIGSEDYLIKKYATIQKETLFLESFF